MKIDIDDVIIICEDRAVTQVVKSVFGHDVKVLKFGSNVAGISAGALERKAMDGELEDKRVVIFVGDATKRSPNKLKQMNVKNKYLKDKQVYNVVLAPEVEKILLYHFESPKDINKIVSRKNKSGKFDPKKHCIEKGYSFDSLRDKEIYDAKKLYYSKNPNEYHNLFELYELINIV